MVSSLTTLLVILLQTAPPELRYLALPGDRRETWYADFDGDGKTDILNLCVDGAPTPPARWFTLHLQTPERSYHENADLVWAAPVHAAAFTVGEFLPDAGYEVLLCSSDGIYVFTGEPLSGKRPCKKLLHLRTCFNTPDPRRLPLWMEPVDLDGDSRDDLLIPTPEGWQVSFQSDPGRFGAAVHLERDLSNPADRSLAVLRTAGSSDREEGFFLYESRLPSLVPADVDGDGRLDLTSLDRGILTVFFQKEPRTYASRRGWRERFPISVLASTPGRDEISVSRTTLTDLDGDGLADLVVTRIEGALGFVESIRTNLFLHRGTGRGNFVADSVIRIDGVSIDPVFMDLNGDRTADCLVSRLRTDLLAQAVKTLVLGDMAITYEVFQFEPQTGRYVETAVYSRDIFVTRDDLTKKGTASVPLVYPIADATGDGRPDLMVVNPKNEELMLHAGEETAFASRRFIGYQSTPLWKKVLPRHPKGLTAKDLNGDGLADPILLHDGAVGVVLSRKR